MGVISSNIGFAIVFVLYLIYLKIKDIHDVLLVFNKNYLRKNRPDLFIDE